MNIKELFTSRRFKYGALSSVISVVVIALVVVLNVVASVLTDRYPLTIDLTPNSAFEISQASADYVKGIERPVEITVLANEKDLESGGDVYYSQVKKVIDQYAQYNKNITVSYVDIVSDPTFAAKHEDLNLNYGDVLVASGTRQRKLSINGMFNAEYNQYTGQQTIKSSKAEQMMTGAIMGVTSDSMVKVSILTGHDEAALPALQSLLEQNNFEVVTTNLATEEIDPSVDIVFWLAPTRDPDTEILNKLDAFLQNNQQFGKTLIYAANAEQPSTPNIGAFLADWGIGVNPGAVLETDQSRIFNYNPYFCVVDYVGGEYMGDLSGDVRVSMPYGRPLEVLFENQSGYETTTLLSYSDTAAVYPLDAGEGWQPSAENMGAVPAAIRSTFTRYEGTDAHTSHVFALSAVSSMENVLLGSKSVANAEYLMNMLNAITEREDVIVVAPKELGGAELGINQLQATLISSVLIYIIPLLIVVTGVVIWLRRRHK